MLSSRFVWEILTHQEMAPRWISTKNIHAKDKPAQLCAHLPPPPLTASSISKWPPKAFAKLQGHLWASCFPHFSESFLKKKKNKKQIKKKKKKPRTFLRTMPQWKEHRPSILRPKFAKNLELGFLFCLVLFCLNQTTTSFKSFTRSNYSVPKHQTCTAHGPHGKAPSAGQPQMLP